MPRAFDFTGIMPGKAGDRYTLVATIQVGGTRYTTNKIVLPDPGGRAGFSVGRKRGGQSFGLFVPDGAQLQNASSTFSVERIANASGFTKEMLQQAAKQNLRLEAIDGGRTPEHRVSTVSRPSGSGSDLPHTGGFWLPPTGPGGPGGGALTQRPEFEDRGAPGFKHPTWLDYKSPALPKHR